MSRKWLAVGIAALSLGVAAQVQAQEYKHGGVTVVAPWARATPGGVNVGGAYLEIKSAPGTADRLIGAKSPVAGSVEIHNHFQENGVMKMRRVDGVDLAPGQTVTLKPGGYHLMLMGLKKPLKQGEKLPITLVFEKAGEIEAEARIGPIGASGPGGQMQPGHASGHHPGKAEPSHKH